MCMKRQEKNSYICPDHRAIFRSGLRFLDIVFDRTIITGSPYSARTTFLRATVLRFLKICKSADYYKVVEATEIVGSRRTVKTS